jgi:hypothetical protein
MSDTVVEEYVYEFWDCPKCGNKGIRGDNYACNQCGFPRDDSITFYRKKLDEAVQTTEQIDKFKKGPDWICSFCNSLNHQDEKHCKGCGATKEDSEKNYFQELAEREKKTKVQEAKSPQFKALPEEANKKSKKGWYIFSGILLSLLGICYYGFRTHKVEYKVTKASWIRTTEIKRYQWSDRSDWNDEIKGDDPVIKSKSEEIRRYESRQVGSRTESYTENESYKSGSKRECSTSYSSTGSGASKKSTRCQDVPTYSTRSVRKSRVVPIFKEFPIYGTKVYYKSKFYLSIGYRIKRGENNTPEWPDPKLGKGVDNKEDKTGEQNESLQITLEKINKDISGPEKQELEVKENEFKTIYLLDTTQSLNVNNLGFVNYSNGEKILDKVNFEEKFKPIFSKSLN